MDQGTMIAIVVGVLVLAAVGWLVWQRKRSEELRARYAPEYERTVTELGDQRRAESELVKRKERVDALEIRALSAGQLNGYLQQWHATQTRFVDDPKGAVTDADRLVEDVMRIGNPVAQDGIRVYPSFLSRHPERLDPGHPRAIRPPPSRSCPFNFLPANLDRHRVGMIERDFHG